MYNLKYIEPEQADVIRRLIKACLTAEPDGYFEICDTEDDVCKSRNADRILKEMDGGDEEFNFDFFGADDICKGWFGVLPYEEPDSVIYDHSDNEFCNKIFDLVTD